MKRSILDIPSVEKSRILEMHKKSSNLIAEQGDFSPYATTMLDNPDYTTTTTTEKKVVEPVGDVVNIKDKPKDEEFPVMEPKDAEPVDVKKTTTEIINIAKNYIGKPYVYGSQGPNGFDCSGFVRFLLSKTGKIESVNDIKKIPRTASGIYSSPSVSKITINEIQPGDLVFFKSGGKISHIGLISNVTSDLKNEKIFHMVHASSSSGIQDTETTNFTKTGVNKNSYWGPKIAGYGRLA
jgi:cell wall-associated NlpC family hydrolase